jgi:hypothetical protein
MEEEKLEVAPEEKTLEPEGEVQDTEEVKSSEKDDFEKDNEVVPVGKYNQSVRKQRELELEKRELLKKLEEKPQEIKEEELEVEEDLFKDDIVEEEKKKPLPDTNKIIDDKLKPVFDTLKKREESDRKIARTAFFDTHPEYESSAEKWQELLDEMDNSINPNSSDDYYTQLEKAHRILVGDTYKPEIEDKKKEIANDATTSGGAEKGSIKDEFTAEDKKYMKEFNISVEGMKAYKEKIKSGSMRILS